MTDDFFILTKTGTMIISIRIIRKQETVSFEFTLTKCSSVETITLQRLMEH